jgi:hypothetical protein
VYVSLFCQINSTFLNKAQKRRINLTKRVKDLLKIVSKPTVLGHFKKQYPLLLLRLFKASKPLLEGSGIWPLPQAVGVFVASLARDLSGRG